MRLLNISYTLPMKRCAERSKSATEENAEAEGEGSDPVKRVKLPPATYY